MPKLADVVSIDGHSQTDRSAIRPTRTDCFLTKVSQIDQRFPGVDFGMLELDFVLKVHKQFGNLEVKNRDFVACIILTVR